MKPRKKGSKTNLSLHRPRRRRKLLEAIILNFNRAFETLTPSLTPSPAKSKYEKKSFSSKRQRMKSPRCLKFTPSKSPHRKKMRQLDLLFKGKYSIRVIMPNRYCSTYIDLDLIKCSMFKRSLCAKA